MVKTRVIRLQGVEEKNLRDQIALGTFLSLRMLATYMRRMRNYNLDLGIVLLIDPVLIIVGDKGNPQLLLRRPIF